MARVPIIMPKMSMTMTEGDVSAWVVKVGDLISEGDVVCEVMTDKVDMEVESPVAGTLAEIVVETGSATVGEPIGWVEGEASALGDLLAEDEAVPRPSATDEADGSGPEPASAPPDEPRSAPSNDLGPLPAVPRARALARAHDIDLANVDGTGREGLITVADVESLVAVPPATTSRPGAGKDRSSLIRAAVARKMAESAGVPQFTAWRDLELDDVNTRRGDVSWTTVFLRAYAAALREVPELLTRWEDGRAVPSGPPVIALAVATPDGLLVPAFAEPDRVPLGELDRELKHVVEAARVGRLDPAYLGTANGSLSNLGGLDVDRFQALVTPPQASVLALGSVRQRPVAVPGGLGVALTVTAGLTVDHRAADGAHAAVLLDVFARHVCAAN